MKLILQPSAVHQAYYCVRMGEEKNNDIQRINSAEGRLGRLMKGTDHNKC